MVMKYIVVELWGVQPKDSPSWSSIVLGEERSQFLLDAVARSSLPQLRRFVLNGCSEGGIVDPEDRTGPHSWDFKQIRFAEYNARIRELGDQQFNIVFHSCHSSSKWTNEEWKEMAEAIMKQLMFMMKDESHAYVKVLYGTKAPASSKAKGHYIKRVSWEMVGNKYPSVMHS
ncbi:MAG: hypothetical protein ACYCQJ_14970 [Nitrososphaerales archaeon]